MIYDLWFMVYVLKHHIVEKRQDDTQTHGHTDTGAECDDRAIIL